MCGPVFSHGGISSQTCLDLCLLSWGPKLAPQAPRKSATPAPGCVALSVTGLMLIPEPPGGTVGRARFPGGQVVLPEGNSGRYRFGHTVWGTADKWCLPEWGGEMFSAVLVKECPALCLSYINPKAAISKEAQVCPAGVARAQLHGPCVKQRPWKDKFTSPERRQHRTQITAHSPPVSTPHACMDIC